MEGYGTGRKTKGNTDFEKKYAENSNYLREIYENKKKDEDQD